MANQRFLLDPEGHVIDTFNSNAKALHYAVYDTSEKSLRESVVIRRVDELVDKLLVEKPYQPPNPENFSLTQIIFQVVKASRLNTLDIALSLQHKFGGELKREKRGWQDFTSLSLFVDDVEPLLRDLYGESDNEAIDRVREAVLVIVTTFTEHLRGDLWQEHRDAQDIDYVHGIGVPEGYGLSGSDHRAAHRAADNLALRARAVRANPTAFSKYTVEFVNELYAHARWLAEPINSA